MQTLRVPININSNGMVTIPLEYLQMLPKDKPFTAIVELPNKDENEDLLWKEMSEKAFFDAYDTSDKIYDSL